MSRFLKYPSFSCEKINSFIYLLDFRFYLTLILQLYVFDPDADCLTEKGIKGGIKEKLHLLFI